MNFRHVNILFYNTLLYSAVTFSVQLYSPYIYSSSDATESLTLDSPFDFDLSTDTEYTNNHGEAYWEWSGNLSFRHRYSSPQSKALSNRVRGEIKSTYKQKKFTFFSRAHIDADPAVTSYRNSTYAELDEFYTAFNTDIYARNTTITLGKQRLAWGTADGLSTIDRVNAIDFKEPISNGRTSARRPSWLLSVEQTLSAGVWQAVWLPKGRDRTLPEYQSPWETSALNQLRTDAIDGNISLTIDDPHKNEGGVRFTHYGQGLDWGFAFFNGYTDAATTITRQQNTVHLRPARIGTINANIAKGFSASTLRGEFSYTPNHPTSNGEQQVLSQWVLGWDRTYFTDFYVNIQFFSDRFSNQSASDINTNNSGITFAVSDKFYDDAIEAGTRGQLARHAQYSIETFIEYTASDNYSLQASYIAFGGEQGSGLAEFTQNDFVQLEIKYYF
jgi:hypothetical protein